MLECIICIEPLNKSNHRAVSCEFCDFVACGECCERHLLSLSTPKCMAPKCGRTWSRRHLSKVMSYKFLTTTYKKHMEQLEYDKERALLPATQERMLQKKRNDVLIEELSEMRKQLSSANEPMQRFIIKFESRIRSMAIAMYSDDRHKFHEMNGRRSKLDWFIHFRENESAMSPRILRRWREMCDEGRGEQYIANVQRMYQVMVDMHQITMRIHEIHAGESDPTTHLQQRALRACPETNCRGFLGDDWECGMCSAKVCATCRVVISTADDDDDDDKHVCNATDVETVKTIDKETRPCPKCSAAIFKIDGCDQMWCTLCHTAFSWKTGAIEKNVHNPHYFEWLRRNGVDDRAVGEAQCGRELDGGFIRVLTLACLTRGGGLLSDQLMPYAQRVSHCRFHDVSKMMDIINDANASYRLRAKFLIKSISEDEFRKRVLTRSVMIARLRETVQVLEMYIHAMTDIMYRMHAGLLAIAPLAKYVKPGLCEDDHEFHNVAVRSESNAFSIHIEEEILSLEKYTNECLAEIANTYRSKPYVVGK